MRSFVAILAIIAATSPAIAQITAISEIQKGQPVTVAGVVERYLDEDEIRLRDDTGTVRVYLGPQPPLLQLGTRVEITGFMDNDLVFNELYAHEIITEGGEVITIRRGYD